MEQSETKVINNFLHPPAFSRTALVRRNGAFQARPYVKSAECEAQLAAFVAAEAAELAASKIAAAVVSSQVSLET